jgi:alpha-beta hydrolase superfamily lysophospholipase
MSDILSRSRRKRIFANFLVLALLALAGTIHAQQATQRNVTFANGEVTLAGTLILPEGEGPFPAVAILHGSGPDTRAPYLPDATMLARAGVAALIYDKRGTGGSSGDWHTASLDDLMADALAAVHFLQDQPEIATDQVGILGSSQGAWLAPFAAARDVSVAFFVQVTGSATPLANQEMWDDGNSLAALGFSPRAIETAMKAQHLLYSARPLIQSGILPLGDLWFVHYDPYLDPADAWSQVRVPALVLYGGQDATVPSRTSLEIVQGFLAENGHPSSRIVVFPDAEHALGGPSRNQNPAYTELVPSWIQAVARGQSFQDTPVSTDDIAAASLRWYGMAAQVTPWYSTAAVQLSLILGFLLASLVAVVLSLIPGARLRLPKVGILPRLTLGLAGAVNLVLIVGLLLTINYLLNADAEQAAPTLPLSGILPILSILNLGLTLALAFVLVRAWRGRAWSAAVRILYSLATVGAMGFVPFLAYWNLLGTQL